MNAASMQRRCAAIRPRRIISHPASSRIPAVPFNVAFSAGRSDTLTVTPSAITARSVGWRTCQAPAASTRRAEDAHHEQAHAERRLAGQTRGRKSCSCSADTP